MKHANEIELLKEELELKAIPSVVSERLAQLKQELPQELPRERHPGRVIKKIFCSTASAVAAALVLLVGVNVVNPAWAESIPGVGGLLKQVNDRVSGLSFVKSDRLERFVQTLDSTQYAVTVEGIDAQVTLEEIYFDGIFLRTGIRMVANGVNTDECFPAQVNTTINGEHVYGNMGEDPDAEGVSTDNGMWLREEKNIYTGSADLLLPQKFWEEEQVSVKIELENFTSTQGFGMEFGGKVTLEFTPTPTREENQVVVGDVAQNGVRFLYAVSTPGGAAAAVEYEEAQYNNPWLSLWDTVPDSFSQFAGGSDFTRDGITRSVTTYSALDESRGEMLLAVFDKNNLDEYVAEFTVNFQEGTVVPSRNVDDPDSPFHYDKEKAQADHYSPEYRLSQEEVEAFSGEYQVKSMMTSTGKHPKGALYLAVLTDQPYRPLRAELYKDGVLACTVASENVPFGQAMGDAWFDEISGFLGFNRKSEYVFTAAEVFFPMFSQVEVRLCDSGTGETVYSETVTLGLPDGVEATEEQLEWNQGAYIILPEGES